MQPTEEVWVAPIMQPTEEVYLSGHNDTVCWGSIGRKGLLGEKQDSEIAIDIKVNFVCVEGLGTVDKYQWFIYVASTTMPHFCPSALFSWCFDMMPVTGSWDVFFVVSLSKLLNSWVASEMRCQAWDIIVMPIIATIYRLWLHGLYGLYGPWYPLSEKGQ